MRLTPKSSPSPCEIIADHLSTAGWSLGRVSAVDSRGRTLAGNGAERVGFERTVLQRLGALSGLALVQSDEVSISLKACAAIRRQLKFG
jgi:hypothetical protein